MKDFAKSIVCNSVTEKEFNTEADLRRWCMDHNYTYTPVGGGYYRLEDDKPGSKRPDLEAHVKAGNSKFGNALKYTNLEEAKKMCQQMNDSLAPDAALRHYRHVYEKDGVYYVMETGEAVAKGMKRVGNSMVGNRTASEIEKEIAEVEASIDSHHRAGENPPKNLEERLKKLKAELANAKTGNSTEKLFYGLSKDAEKEEEKSDEALDELKKTGNKYEGTHVTVKYHGKTADVKVLKDNGDGTFEAKTIYGAVVTIKESDIVGNKVGNATPNYRYKGFLITNPEGEYVVFLQDGIHVAFRGTRSKAMAEDWCDWHDPKTGKALNSKVGNKYNIKPMSYKADAYRYGKELAEKDFKNFKYSNTSTLETIYRNNTSGEDYEQYGFLDFKRGYYDTYQQMDKKVGNSKTGNSASDDKFAYVMREFDEGKLKTPDGKVVTDPQQAKAIAYSESKKTENGLARARNAIKKNS